MKTVRVDWLIAAGIRAGAALAVDLVAEEMSALSEHDEASELLAQHILKRALEGGAGSQPEYDAVLARVRAMLTKRPGVPS